MQDYYNMLPIFSIGGSVNKIIQKLSKAKLTALENSHKDIRDALKKISEAKAKGEKISEADAQDLVKIIQKYRKSTPFYQNRRKKVNEMLAKKHSEKPKSTKEKVSETKQKVADTLSSRYNTVKSWINNHPKTILWGAGLGIGTGPGRYVLGNALKFTQTNPETWFGGDKTIPANPGESVLTLADGTTIKGTWQNGVFTPATSTSAEATPSGDVADQQIADIIAGVNASPETPSTGYQTDFNDLFSEDAWE